MNKKGFTLVELIVVIAILAILSTVAFISFQWYAQSARDSVRLSDIQSITKIVNLYSLQENNFPEPDGPININYSGSLAWTQWDFWTSAYTNSSSMWGTAPTDPLTGVPYMYSSTHSRKEYQVAGILEWSLSYYPVSSTYAWDDLAQAYVKWNYNGKIIKIYGTTEDYILWVPSILASDITSVDIISILASDSLIYHGYNNISPSYSGSVFNNNGWFGFTPTESEVVVFSGSLEDLWEEWNDVMRAELINNLQDIYLWSIIENTDEVQDIVNVDLSDPWQIDYLSSVIVNDTLWWTLELPPKVEIWGGWVSIDTSAPILSNVTPTSALIEWTTSVDITFDTNENADCKYSLNPNVDYDSMTSIFDTTGTMWHLTDIDQLTDGVNYTYYVRCSDIHGNKNITDEVVQISVTPNINTFITTWDVGIDVGSTWYNSIDLPLYNTGSYNFTVDWWDRSLQTITQWDQADRLHNYSSGGVYQVTINGTITEFGFRNASMWTPDNQHDGDKLVDVNQWWNMLLSSFIGSFNHCENITVFSATDTPQTSHITNMSGMFMRATNFNSPIWDWNVENVTTMLSMFKEAENFDQDISLWQITDLEDMSFMFMDAKRFNQNISAWNVSGVTDMRHAFQATEDFNQNLSSWATSTLGSCQNFSHGSNPAWLLGHKPAFPTCSE